MELKREFENDPRQIELNVLESEVLLAGIPTAESLKAFQLAIEQVRGTRQSSGATCASVSSGLSACQAEGTLRRGLAQNNESASRRVTRASLPGRHDQVHLVQPACGDYFVGRTGNVCRASYGGRASRRLPTRTTDTT